MKSPENKPPRGMTLEATFSDGKRPSPASLGSGGRNNNNQESSGLADYLAWPGRICLLLAVVISPWIFASVNFGPQRWIAISLLVGLGFWWFESSMNARRKQVFPLLFFPLALGILLGLIQLIPFPESSSLLGRQVEIQQQLAGPAVADGASAVTSTSISVDPDGTWHHLRLLVIALTAMLLGSRYFRTKQDIKLLLTTFTANGVAISLFGIINSLTSNGKMFWFHEVTMGGQFFGPFVNRNNSCCYLLICLAAAIGLLPIVLGDRHQSTPKTIGSRDNPFWRQLITHIVEFVADLNAKKIGVLLAIMLIGTAIIASLSRGGTVAMLFGAIVSLLAYGMARQPKNSLFVFIPILLLAGLMIGFWSFGDGLTERFEEINTVEIEKDLRVAQWKSTWPATREFGILGSGLGTYRGVHRGYRKDTEFAVYHYAENQYFQGLVEAGWPGLLIYLTAWFLAFQSTILLLNRGQSPTSIGVGLMGMFLIASQAVASALDFGFYIPANTLALAVMFGFLSYQAQALGGRLKKPSWLRLQVPSVVVSTVVLIMFGSTCLVAYGLHQRARIDGFCSPRVTLMTHENMNLEQSTKRLDQLLPLIKARPTPKGLNYAAGLLIHRCRLQLLDAITAENEIEQIVGAVGDPNEKEETKKTVLNNLWNTTQLMQLQEHANFLKSESRIQLSKFKAEPGIQQNLPLAIQLLEYSREISPLQPLVHLRLAQINAILGNESEADRCIERTLEVAPMNPTFRKIAGLYYLQSDRPKLAAVQFRHYLELQPDGFTKTIEIATGRSNRSITPIPADVISTTLLPDEPRMLYLYATRYQQSAPEKQQATFKRAAKLLDDMEFRDNNQNRMLGDIRRLQGETEKAIEAYNDYLLIVPHNENLLYQRALLYEQLGKLELALEDANRLIDRAANSKKYRDFARKLRSQLSEREETRR